MKWSLFILLFFAEPFSVQAQQKYTVESGTISFTSNADLEIINAVSDKLQGLLDPASNKFVFVVPIQSFKGFNSAMQKEHFNEKYLESDRFPKAIFAGKIIEELDLAKNGTFDVRAKGELDIHGVKQTRIIKSKITIANGNIIIDAKFALPLLDHNITIPTIISHKIATEMEIVFSAIMIMK